jgi:superfamily II DNA/RNA helicase
VTNDSQKHEMIKQFITANQDKKMLIFTETKEETKSFGDLDYAQFRCLHGDIDQRRRTQILSEFRRPESRSVLVATDVAARGLDIEDVDAVVQFDIRKVDSFIHRAGRTGRKGKDGVNVLFLTHQKLDHAVDIEKQLGITFEYANSMMDAESQEEQKGKAISSAMGYIKQLT